ncbi:MAG: hypothetical protein HQM09_05070 [Candidatus Riflebacteria bacterium]|nr:hypothetical protein [Candidatus Riflebacteria bacterium]
MIVSLATTGVSRRFNMLHPLSEQPYGWMRTVIIAFIGRRDRILYHKLSASIRGLLVSMFTLILCGCINPQIARAVERDDVYRLCGSYRVVKAPGLCVYYPAACESAMGRIMNTFSAVRMRIGKAFGSPPSAFTITVQLTDHDDRDAGFADSAFDLVTMSLFEETDSLSTRGYSLEQRFALRLSHIMILRALGPARTALKRRMALLSVPSWFREGLAMHYAFPMDALHHSRLLEMARTSRLYSLDDLDTIADRPESEKDRMRFQARHMIDFWHEKAGPDAGKRFLAHISGHPVGFAESFKTAFGMTFSEAMRAYDEQVKTLCRERNSENQTSSDSFFENGLLISSPGVGTPTADMSAWSDCGAYCQALRQLPEGSGQVFVSSRRYTEEIYDLYIQPSGKSPRLALKNVHSNVWVDPASGTVFLGKYGVNRRRERRLGLYAVPRSGKPFLLHGEPGSYKPLGMADGRLFFVNMRAGRTRLMSMAPVASSPVREEMLFPPEVRPLDLAVDPECKHVFFTVADGGNTLIVRCPIASDTNNVNLVNRTDRVESAAVVLYRQAGMIRRLQYFGGALWFAAESVFRTPQLFSLSGEKDIQGHKIDSDRQNESVSHETLCADDVITCTDDLMKLVRYSAVPGGIWDYDIRTDGICAVTILENGFRPIRLERKPLAETSIASPRPFVPVAGFLAISIPSAAAISAVASEIDLIASAGSDLVSVVAASNSSLIPIFASGPLALESRPYRLEYKHSYWLPRMNRDDQGATLGFYSYRADRLDRRRLIVSPTYGFKSRNFGYIADYLQRFDQFRSGFTVEDRVVQKSYRSDSYYERVRSSDIHFSFPFTLSTTLSVGGNITDRGIAKYPERGQIAPTIGQDNSLYLRLDKRAIRTEPFWEVFPRKGRDISASYRKGLTWFGGKMVYDSTALRWQEYAPLGRGWVGATRFFVAEDNKKDEIRRPDDLSLGGSDFLRGYDSSVRYGDSLRAVCLHLSHEIPISFEFIRRWAQKEIVVGEIFWEKGDVRSNGRAFSYLEDHGIEFRAKGLILRRLPITVRWGSGWAPAGGKRHGYWTVDFAAISDLIQ